MSFVQQHHSSHCLVQYGECKKGLFKDNDWACAFVPAIEMGLTYEDVTWPYAADDGENDERDWIAIFHTKADQWLLIESGCDYTGWDCQSSGVATLYESLEQAIDDMGDDQKHRLGLPLTSANFVPLPVQRYAMRVSE